MRKLLVAALLAVSSVGMAQTFETRYERPVHDWREV